MINFKEIDNSWTLFLDRDGVINKKLDNDYVKTINEFEFLPFAEESIAAFSNIFGRIIIVTNQQGIGKGLMTEADLVSVHQHLKNKIMLSNGHIDAIYHAPKLASENSSMRKPNIGMALKAKENFPAIDFNKSIMVGDSVSDMLFAEKAKMKKVFISKEKNTPYLSVDSLVDFYKLIIDK
jgi:histidinol-phosphate phosphatase family protein